ncbi:MAG: phage tail sheath subtilisin-like domain-containing protein [Oscillospiraceae bacterium]|nr:phage tail sheath subtilisin-like domain-containing protein [Oscillospiraceae bacterium]
MAEYLSPGVYVEKYDSGAIPMQGAFTDIAGFIGLAEKGPITGKPQLVKSFEDYKKIYGGYLSEAEYGSSRYLPYSVEQYFNNGGSRAYIMRLSIEKVNTSGAVKTTDIHPDVYIGTDNGPGMRTGLQAFIEIDDVSAILIPGVTAPEVQRALITFCENKKTCVAILDLPIDRTDAKDAVNYQGIYESSYAAYYHPWIQFYDALKERNAFFPPSGAIAGIYARTDAEKGVNKAPANEIVRACTGISVNIKDCDQDILNAKGINIIRSFTGRGIRVWGARTTSTNAEWKYINIRRLFIYVEQSIRLNTQWVIYEQNQEPLWVRVKNTVEMFLNYCQQTGMLAGNFASEAFFVECGRTTMSQNDIDNCKLICKVGVALLKPSEFIIFNITQKTAPSE